jgi:hypothetical protein
MNRPDTAHRRAWEEGCAAAYRAGAQSQFRGGAASAGVATLALAAPWEHAAFRAIEALRREGIDTDALAAYLDAIAGGADPASLHPPTDGLGRPVVDCRDAHGRPVDLAPLLVAHTRVCGLREAAPNGTAY